MGALDIILLLMMLGVVAVLVGGMFYMLRGKEGDSQKSNKMMVMRVAFQAGALVVLAVLYLVRH